MRKEEFLATAKKIATETPTRYELGGVGQYKDYVFLFDCVGLIKSILWGFDFDKNAIRGGAEYCSNGVPDYGANKFFKECCYDHSTNMSLTEPGELVWLDGHIGIYLGDLNVIEATSDWDNDVLISHMDYDGYRSYNYSNILRWTHHAKCKFIDYSNYKFKIGDNVKLNGWLHKTRNSEECVGEFHDYVWTISNIVNDEYPYELNSIGYCREKYLQKF